MRTNLVSIPCDNGRVIDSNERRKGFVVSNNTSVDLLLLLASGMKASPDEHSLIVKAGTWTHVDIPYTGEVSVYWDGEHVPGDPLACITELFD